MRYLFIVPRFKQRFGTYYELPLGIGYVSASLKKAGFETHIVNLNHIEGNIKDIISREVMNNDVVCTGGLSVHYPQIEEIFNSIPPDKNVIKLCGGGIITSEPFLITDALNLDVAIIGEGEGPIVEYATKGTATPQILDINTIPYPDFEGLGVDYWLSRQKCLDEHYMYVEDYPRCMPILSSRGCPYRCTFCFSPLGKKYRQRTIKHFFDEVEYLCSKYNINILTILDETIGVDKDRLITMCKELKRFNLKWMTQMRVDAVDKNILALMKESGCYQISYGVESASQRVLDSMKKKTTVEQITNALTLTREIQIGVQGGLIFGDPAETLETFAESLAWNMKHKEFTLNLMSVNAYPGTELYERYVKQVMNDQQRLKWIKDGCPGYINVNLMGIERMKDILKSLQIDNLTRFYMIAKVLEAEEVEYDKHRGSIMKFTWRCPHCHQLNTFTNSVAMQFLMIRPPMIALASKLGCRKCHGRSTQIQWEDGIKDKLKKEVLSNEDKARQEEYRKGYVI